MTQVVEGPFAGKNLKDIVALNGEELFGQPASSSVFPLLYKFIYAREKLSVQVHPDPGSALGESKTECWYVVDAAPGAELIVGVSRHGRSREDILAALKSSHCEEVLRRWPAKRGDVFFIPAGTVHAITEGLLLYEVQQNSDTTFRLYDWGRVDGQGNPRPLHVEQAAEVADLEEREGYKIEPLRVLRESHSEGYLVACPYFALVKWHGFRERASLEMPRKFCVVSVVSGSFEATTEDGQGTALQLGDTMLIPASQERIHLEQMMPHSELILSFVPDLQTDIRAPLQTAGYSDGQIQRIFGPKI